MSTSSSRKQSISDTSSVDSNSSSGIDKEIDELMDLLSNSTNRKFFLDHLIKLKNPTDDSFELKLKTSQFKSLVDIMKKIVNGRLILSNYEATYTCTFVLRNVEWRGHRLFV